jgi:hypothetical protein
MMLRSPWGNKAWSSDLALLLSLERPSHFGDVSFSPWLRLVLRSRADIHLDVAFLGENWHDFSEELHVRFFYSVFAIYIRIITWVHKYSIILKIIHNDLIQHQEVVDVVEFVVVSVKQRQGLERLCSWTNNKWFLFESVRMWWLVWTGIYCCRIYF